MRKALVILVLSGLFFYGHGQTLPKNDPLKLDADYYLMDKDFKKAMNNYLTVLKTEPDNADIKYKIGICYLNSENEKAKAIPYLQEASLKVSEKYNSSSFKETNAPVDAFFLLGSAYRINNQLDEAMNAYSSYKNYLDPKDDYNLSVVDQYLKNCEYAKSMKEHPVQLTTVNLGSPVNTVSANYNAIISGDGKTLFYTSPSRQGYDIFMCTRVDSAWSSPKLMTSALGSSKYMLTTDLSRDGQTLLLTLEDPLNSEIYISHLAKGRWSKAEPLPKEINSKYNETHASLSTDGKTIFFTSDRKGGLGDLDIYKSVLDVKGSWGKAENLGPVINTRYNEETPFMAEQGDKLFFSSEGHEGMGGYDIFYYDFSNPAAGVVNLGFPLNSTDNDLFYMPVGDGMTGYYSLAASDAIGGRDIYRVTVEERVGDEENGRVGEMLAEAIPDSVVPEEAKPDSVADLTAFATEERVGDGETGRVGEESEQAKPDSVADLTAFTPEERVGDGETGSVGEASSMAFSYKVQIMALKKPVDFKKFDNLSGVVVSYQNDTWYRYTLGNFSNRSEAEVLLGELVAKGYHDAFIKTEAIFPKFTIQIMAVPGPLVDMSAFSQLPEIFATRGTDHFCRYTTGEFGTKEEALISLNDIKEKFDGAFVTVVGW
ncbi:MAG TPA: SPOR domain-containing protein [Bacteroidales bacterium]|nr:SPOR domain-containing protein [Bacteroidales bacterium]